MALCCPLDFWMSLCNAPKWVLKTKKKSFVQLYGSNGIFPWEIRVAFPGESQLRQRRATQPTVHAGCFSVSIIPLRSDMDCRIFNVRTEVNACNCTRGCTDTRKRVCIERWLWEKNPLPHRGIEPDSAAWRSDALTNWATSPTSVFCNTSRLFFGVF